MVVKLLVEGFGDFLYVGGAVWIIVDEKLDFVEDDHGARYLVFDGEYFVD